MKFAIWMLAFAASPGLAMAQESTDYERGYRLAEEKGCFDCHAIGYTDAGPSFRAIADRYRFDPYARQRLPYVIMGGSAGHWGERFIMWPQRRASEQEVRMLVDWVLAQ